MDFAHLPILVPMSFRYCLLKMSCGLEIVVAALLTPCSGIERSSNPFFPTCLRALKGLRFRFFFLGSEGFSSVCFSWISSITFSCFASWMGLVLGVFSGSFFGVLSGGFGDSLANSFFFCSISLFFCASSVLSHFFLSSCVYHCSARY